MIILTACNPKSTKAKDNWAEGFDSKQAECFDTVICENGDSLLIIQIATDSII